MQRVMLKDIDLASSKPPPGQPATQRVPNTDGNGQSFSTPGYDAG
jgi:hypothetical protein